MCVCVGLVERLKKSNREKDGDMQRGSHTNAHHLVLVKREVLLSVREKKAEDIMGSLN